jgi:hypothetical protein
MLKRVGAAAAVYAVGQLANLLFQGLLMQHLGAALYAEVGLAHLLFLSVLFVADLGYASLFLRERPDAPGWLRRWRQALGHRLLASVLLYALVLLGWRLHYGPGSAGLDYLWAAAPAAVFALGNCAAPFMARGERLRGVAMQQIAWPVALLAGVVVAAGLPGQPALAAGLAVSLGYLAQALVNLYCFRRPAALLPTFGRGEPALLRSALHIAAMGIAGTLHERLTPFLLAPLVPTLMPAYLLLGHLLSGLSGVFVQLNRLLTAEASAQASQAWASRLASLLLVGSAGLLLLAAAGVLLRGVPAELAFWQLALPLLLGWSLSSASGLAAALLIGRGREPVLARAILAGLAVSAVLQLGGAALGSAEIMLWGRLCCLLGLAWLSLRLLGQRLNRTGIAVLLACLLLAGASVSLFCWAASLALFGAALARLGRRRHGLFRPARPTAVSAGHGEPLCAE